MRSRNVDLWFPDVLPDVECRSIAKSCARYSLMNFDETAFSERSRRKTGKQWHGDFEFDYATRDAGILSLNGMGFRQTEIADVMDISQPRVSQILREITRKGRPEDWEPYT